METTLQIEDTVINFEGIFRIDIVANGLTTRLGLVYSNTNTTPLSGESSETDGQKDANNTFVNLYFSDRPQPTMTFFGQKAVAIHKWIQTYHHRNNCGFAEIMGHVPPPEVRLDIIQALRHLASTSQSPSEMLHYLKNYVGNEALFIHYLRCAFEDDDLFPIIGSRYWTGSYPENKADSILMYALQKTEHRWKHKKD